MNMHITFMEATNMIRVKKIVNTNFAKGEMMFEAIELSQKVGRGRKQGGQF